MTRAFLATAAIGLGLAVPGAASSPDTRYTLSHDARMVMVMGMDGAAHGYVDGEHVLTGSFSFSEGQCGDDPEKHSLFRFGDLRPPGTPATIDQYSDAFDAQSWCYPVEQVWDHDAGTVTLTLDASKLVEQGAPAAFCPVGNPAEGTTTCTYDGTQEEWDFED